MITEDGFFGLRASSVQASAKIIRELQTRKGLRQLWETIDAPTRENIQESWAEIIEDTVDEVVFADRNNASLPAPRARIFLWIGVAILIAAMDYAVYQAGKSVGTASCTSVAHSASLA